MVMLSVGPGDQVFGVSDGAPSVGGGDDGRAVVFRTGVSHSDLSGKTWRPLTAPPVRMRTASNTTSTTSTASSTPRAARRGVAGKL